MSETTVLDLFPSAAAGRFGRRQKRARGTRLPVTIVSGFLGAGKTTLVQRFLKTPGLDWQAETQADWTVAPADHVTTRYEEKKLGDTAPIFLEFVRV